MPKTRIQELIDYLQGTCKSLYDGCTICGFDESDLTDAEREELDSQIFECAECGWWWEVSEESGIDPDELICNECVNDE